MKKFKLAIITVFLLLVCGGVSVQAAEYKKVTSKKEKTGYYYTWIDKQQSMHIRKVSAKKDLAVIKQCKGAVTNGSMIYYIRKYQDGVRLSRYSLSGKKGQNIAYLKGVRSIAGAYQNRIVLYAEPSGPYGAVYVYDLNTRKMKRISGYSMNCTGNYRQYFILEGFSGAITETPVGVYNAKTNKVKTLTKKSWYMVQNGNQVYYAKEVGSTSNYTVRKLRIYRYTLTTGKTKAMTKTLTVSVLGNNKLKKNQFTYCGKDGKKHTVRF